VVLGRNADNLLVGRVLGASALGAALTGVAQAAALTLVCVLAVRLVLVAFGAPPGARG
jgi:hypothetical protein